MMMQEAVGMRDRQVSGQYSKEQQRSSGEREQEQALKCPRCDSPNTKFCYYNNYNLTQPRHFCKTCRRYWTKGGALRNVPIGGGCRKNKKSKQKPKDQNPLDHHEASLNVSNGLSLLHNLWPTPAASSTFLDLPSPDRFVNFTFAKLQNHSSLLPSTINSNSNSSSSSVSIMSMLQLQHQQQQQEELSMKSDGIENPSGGHMMNLNLFRNPGSHMMAVAPPSSMSTIEAGTCSLNFGVESLSINNSNCVDTRDWAWRLQQQQRMGMEMVVANQPQNSMDSGISIPDHLILGDQRFSHVQHQYLKGKTAAVSNDLVHAQPYDIRPLSEWHSMTDSLLEATPAAATAPEIGESSSYWQDLQTM